MDTSNSAANKSSGVCLFNKDACRMSDVELDEYLAAPDPEVFDMEKIAALLPDVELQEHQERVRRKFKDNPNQKMLLMHALGSGKSLTGIAAAEGLGEPYTAVVPASLRNNMNKEIEKFTDQRTPHDVMSYTAIAKGDPVPNNSTLIFDEAHRLRNIQSKQTQRALQLAQQAKQVALLTGTPIVNDPSDFAAPMSILTDKQITPAEFHERYVGQKEVAPSFFQRLRGVTSGVEEYIAHKDELADLLKGKIDYYAPDKPTVDTKYTDVPVEMGKEQAQLYNAMYNRLPWIMKWKLKWSFPLSHDEMTKLTSFMSGPRQVGLSTVPFQKHPDYMKGYEQSPKLQKAMELLQEKLKDKRTKALVFSNFIDAGLRPYSAALDQAKVPHAIFHGGLNDAERKKLVDDYNSNKIRVALLGPSGAEGLSFKGSQLVQLLDAHFNAVRGRQSAARGIRYDSHWNLPEDLQNVEVQRFIAKLPLGLRQRFMKKFFKRDYSEDQRASDDYLTTMSNRKDQTNKQFIDLLRELGTEKKQADYAAGIPDKSVLGDLDQLKEKELYDYVVQKHLARRAGKHYDVRFGSPETGMYSWAVRKGLPMPGDKHLAVQQPVHSHGYKDFEGEIPEGYGAGTVSTEDKGQVLITGVSDKAISFSTAHTKYPQRYILVKPKVTDGKNWLLMNTTKTEPYDYTKLHYKTLDPKQVDDTLASLKPGSSVQAKIDGAASITNLMTKHFDTASYRTSRKDGRPIVHTERVFGGRPEVDVPPDLRGTLLRGELYGTRDGKAVHPGELTPILNSNISNALANKKRNRIDLKQMVFDIAKYGKKPVDTSVPYDERRKMIQDVLSRVNFPEGAFHQPEEATTPETAKALWDQVRAGQNPLSYEGIAVHPPTGTPTKVKIRPDFDVHVTGVFPGEGKYKGVGAGGFTYANEAGGPTIGRVGTGLSDEMRRMLMQDPDSYVGRVARIQSHEKLPSGAHRVPSFISLHEDYPAKMASVIDGIVIENPKGSTKHFGDDYPIPTMTYPVDYGSLPGYTGEDIQISTALEVQD